MSGRHVAPRHDAHRPLLARKLAPVLRRTARVVQALQVAVERPRATTDLDGLLAAYTLRSVK